MHLNLPTPASPLCLIYHINMINFYAAISLPLQRRLAQLTIAKYRTSLLQTLPARHSNGRPYNWGKKPSKELLDGTTYFGANGQPKVSRLLLETWYQQQRGLRQQVAASLQAAAYEVAAVPGTKPVAISRVKVLNKQDISRREEGSFYYPSGQPLAVEATDEEVTLMAALLGWSVLDIPSVADAPLDVDVKAALTSTADKPTNEALLNMFRPASNGATILEAPQQPALSDDSSGASRIAQEELFLPPPTAVTLVSLEELDALAAAATELAGQLKEYGQQLEAGELPPSLVLQTAALTALHGRYKVALASITVAGTLTHTLVLPATPQPPTLDYLRRALIDIETTQQAIQQADVQQKKALGVLAQVLTLRHKAEPASVLLVEVFAQAHTLLNELASQLPPAKHPARVALADGTHILAQLVRLVANPTEAETLEESDPIPQALFATLPGSVVSALLRGRLILEQEASSHTTAPVDEEKPAAPGAVGISAEVSTETNQVAPTAEIPTEVSLQQSEVETELQASSNDLPALSSSLKLSDTPVVIAASEAATIAVKLPPPATTQGETEEVGQVALPNLVTLPTTASSAVELAVVADTASLDWLADTQWDLLEHRRFALAWHLTAATIAQWGRACRNSSGFASLGITVFGPSTRTWPRRWGTTGCVRGRAPTRARSYCG